MVITIIIIILGLTLRLLAWLCQRTRRPESEHITHLKALRRQMILDGRLKTKTTLYGAPQGFATTPIKPHKPTQLAIDTTPAIPQRRILIVKPQPPEPIIPSNADIRTLASLYRYEYQQELDATKYLYKDIMDNGGLKPYANNYLAEEFQENVPAWYRRSTGLAPDEMAQATFHDDDTALYAAINKAEIRRKTLVSQKKSFASYTEDAKTDLIDQLNIHTE